MTVWVKGVDMMQGTPYWIGFNLVKGIGPVRLQNLLRVFGDVEAAWKASASQLRAAGLSEKLTRQLITIRQDVSLRDTVAALDRRGIKVLTWEDPCYPERLRRIPQSPFVLYVQGALTEEDDWAVAVVGTRRYSGYGGQVAENTARELARNGITVVSGLARGIDGIAHRCALEEGGRTIAVLGSGLDRLYPPEHRQLAEKICRRGAVISDYPLGTPPDGSNFPPRNRIISGLSRAVVVIEAGFKSGALITANYAADQGRDVLAVPGNITSPRSRGTNLLIQQGAHPLLRTKDIFELLELTQFPEQRAARQRLPENPTEALLFQTLGSEPLHVDELSAAVDLPVSEVSSALAMMELKGLVRKVFGMKYMAVQEKRVEYQPEQLDGELKEKGHNHV